MLKPMSPTAFLCLTPLRLAEIAANPLPPAPPRAAAEDRATCLDPDTLGRADGLGTGFDRTFATEHFLLAWKSGNTAVTEEWLSVYADALEASWEAEIDGMGWRAPDQTDACRVTVLLADFDASWGDTGGYTDVKAERGVPYMALNTDWQEYGEDWIQTLVAHEFNHASQFAYGVFWIEEDWWYWEATAEWAQDLVFEDANTYVWSLWAYLDTPWRALDSMAGTVQYGHFAFNTHLEETWDADLVQAVWEGATNRDNVEDAVERATGEIHEQIVAAYSSRVAAIDVAERDVWLEAIGSFEMDPWTHVTSLPAEGGVEGRGAPQERGQNFLWFQLDAGDGFTFNFTGSAEVDGVATDWLVAYAEVRAGGTVHGWTRADGASGKASIELGGDDVTEVYVAVVPFGEIGENGASYTWAAEGRGGADTGPDAPDDTGPTDDGDPAGDGGEEPGACGCATPTGPTGALGFGLAALALLRRRR